MIDREYIKLENKAHENLIKKGYTPQGADNGFKTVCVMKFEHPEFWDHPIKRGKCEVFHFKNWQGADNGFKTVCVMKFEHPEFWDHPIKRGKCEVFHFKNWQEADTLLK